MKTTTWVTGENKAIGWLRTESPEYINGLGLDLNNGSTLQ